MTRTDIEDIRNKEQISQEISNRITPLQFISDPLYMRDVSDKDLKTSLEVVIDQCEMITEILTKELAYEGGVNEDNKKSN